MSRDNSEIRSEQHIVSERRNSVLCNLAEGISNLRWNMKIEEGLRVGLWIPQYDGCLTIKLSGDLNHVSYTFGRDYHYIFETSDGSELRFFNPARVHAAVMHQDSSSPYISIPARSFGKKSKAIIFYEDRF